MSAYVTEICSQCGNLKSVCSVEGQWFPQRDVCYATAAREQTSRALYAKHGQPEPKSRDGHYMDGTSLWMSAYDLTPDDTFGGALGVLPQQSEGDEGEPADPEEERAQ